MSRRVESRDAVVGNWGARERRVDVLIEREGGSAVVVGGLEEGGLKRVGCLDSAQFEKYELDSGKAIVKDLVAISAMGWLTQGK